MVDIYEYLQNYGEPYHQKVGELGEYWGPHNLPFEFFQTVIEKHNLNKEAIYELLTQCINFGARKITVEQDEFKKLIQHYSLFDDIYVFKDNIQEEYFTMLLKMGKHFNVPITKYLFNWYWNLDNIIWIYEHCNDKELFDKSIKETHLNSSSFVTWYAAITNDINFVFNFQRFQYVDPSDLKELVELLKHDLSIKDVEGLCMGEEMYQYFLTSAKEKDDPFEMYKGIINIQMNTESKKKLLWDMIEHCDDSVEYFYELCKSKIDNLPTIRMFINSGLPYNKFHFIKYTGGKPDGNQIKIIRQMDCPKELLIDSVYYFFWNNEKWGFERMCHLLKNSVMDIDIDTIDKLFSQKFKAEFNCDINSYSLDILPNDVKTRRSPNKKKMLDHLIELKNIEIKKANN